jgi:SAM-dependent methyltransferase
LWNGSWENFEMDEKKIRFWNQKILQWEWDKYKKTPGFFDFNRPLKARRKIATDLLKDHGKGKSVLELGCGSGLLLEELAQVPLHSYCGIDFSPLAIEEARKRASSLSLKFPVEFKVASVNDLGTEDLKSNLCFSLGLTDWLSDKELIDLFGKIQAPEWFHSYSSPQQAWKMLAHRIYVILLYGRKDLSYTPIYRNEDELKKLIGRSFQILSNSELGIGKFAINLRRDG